ncbi:MAG: glucosyltransferase domain-containing protein [Oscillospiraceae bacterium]|nr:glucosyltransferase domain-containing protein [Oscillospiraceae bacterium]
MEKKQELFLLEKAAGGVKGWFGLPYRKAAFWAAFWGGLGCHMYVFCNMLPNHDWQHNFYATQNWLASGRWFLQYACQPTSFAVLPWLLGLLSVFYIALAAVLAVDVLKLHRPVLAGVAGLMMAVFPSVGSTATYLYTMDGYMLSLLLAVLAVWFMEKWPAKMLGCIPGMVCMGLSMGIYQAYGACALLLFCFLLVLKMLREQPKLIEIILYVVRMGLVAAGGFVFYYVMLQLVLKLSGQELGGYQGIDNLGGGLSLSAEGILLLLQMVLNAAYGGWEFLTEELPALGGSGFGGAMVRFLYLCLVVLWVLLAAAKKQWRRWWAIPAQLALMALVPLGVNYVQVISPEVSFHLVMHYSAVLVFVFVLCLLQEAMEEEALARWLRQGASVAVPAAAVALAFAWVVMTNRGYTNMQYQYEESYATLVRLADRMEQCEGYEPGMPLMFSDYDWQPAVEYSAGDLTGLSGMKGMHLFDSLHYRNDFEVLFGLKFSGCSWSEAEPICFTQEYKTMPVWPAQGSVKVIDGVMVVKTTDALDDLGPAV